MVKRISHPASIFGDGGRIVCATLLVVAMIGLGGCKPAVLDPAGPVGMAERTILFNSLGIMLAIIVPTIVATLGFAWWFRASNDRATHRPDWSYSGAVELVTWSIPVLVVLFLGGIAWIGSHDLDPGRTPPSREKPLRIQVVSLDWKWLFIYPDHGVASVNQLAVTAGTPIEFSLTSSSVMNTFFVPRLGSMIYTMNGMVTRLFLQADKEGEFDGLSGHFSGDGFPTMRFKLQALPADGFAKWIADAKASGTALDKASYQALAEPSESVPPKTFRLADGQLFDAIATQMIPPAPGPRPDVSPKPSQHSSHH